MPLPDIIRLRSQRCNVQNYDTQAMKVSICSSELSLRDNPYEVWDADALLLATEWNESWILRKSNRQWNVILDDRNIWDGQALQKWFRNMRVVFSPIGT